MTAHKTKKRGVIFSLLLVVLITVAVGCAPGPKQREFITIGALLPLTGKDSDEGLRALNGLMLAKKEINNSGGVMGKTLDIFVLNDRGDEEHIIQQYNALKTKNVAAIIGSSYSDATMALALAAEKDGIPVITPTASNSEITKGRRNIFRAIFVDDYQAEAMAKFAHDQFSAKTAVILENGNSSSFMRTAQVFGESFRNNGGKIIAVERYFNENDFPFILSRYAANPPDVFYCPENYIAAVALINASYEQKLVNTPLLGTDSWDGILAFSIHPGAMKNVFYTAPFLFDDQDEDVMRFVRNYFHTFSQMPLSGSATAYTCLYILAEAINKAGNTKADDIITAIKTNELNMITGRIKFDENNNPRTNIYIISISSGVYSIFEKLNL